MAQTAGTASGSALMNANSQLMNYGFNAAGDDAIGLVAIPRIQGPFGTGKSVGWNPVNGPNPNANPLIDLARPWTTGATPRCTSGRTGRSSGSAASGRT